MVILGIVYGIGFTWVNQVIGCQLATLQIYIYIYTYNIYIYIAILKKIEVHRIPLKQC